jgi:hypothetical protein
VIVTKDLPGEPEYTVELRNWQTNPQVPAGTFAFTPPAGSQRIDLEAARRQAQPPKRESQ